MDHTKDNPASPALLEVRDKIDALDNDMLSLLSERASLAEKVAEIKRASGETDICFYRPEREAQILRRVSENNPGPLKNEQITRIYREIISSCLALEQCLKVAYLGPEGTFSQEAVNKHFGHAVESMPLSSISQVFREVESGNVDYGLVPIENSTEGVVSYTLDMFVDSSLKICGEVLLRIHHNLLSTQIKLEKIKRIYSHQQSLAQCRDWLLEHLPNIEQIPVSSNAEAVRKAKTDADAAAIAGIMTSEIYDVPVLASNIEDSLDNTTRFLVLGKQDVPPSGDDKSTLMVSAKNRSGALYHLLAPLAEHGLDMTRIESRPSRNTNWEYFFFMDIHGHKQDAVVMTALLELEKEADLLRILGSYPKAIL